MVCSASRGPVRTIVGLVPATPDAPLSLTIPPHLLPQDGRFGSGPSKVRAAQVEALAAGGSHLLGTSHRQAPVRALVGRVRAGLADLLSLPDGYEIVLGNGGSTAFWDVATLCLVRERSAHAVFGEFGSKFAAAAGRAPFLGAPVVTEAAAGPRRSARSSSPTSRLKAPACSARPTARLP